MLKYAIVGTGGMANMHVEKLKEIDDVELVGACDLDESKVKEFAQKHGIPNAFTDFAKMLKEVDFAAISVVAPDSVHALLSLQAIAAGKHVLCEKPLATNAEDAKKMAQAAKEAGVINMVNFSYRDSSAWQRAVQLIQSGELGKIYHFEGHYFQSWLTSSYWGHWKEEPNWLWRLSTKHGSHGALGDIGVHLVDFAVSPIGKVSKVSCHLKTFDKAPGNQIGDYVLDANDSALITLECDNGAAGSLSITRLATGYQNNVSLTIHGERGAIRMDLDKSYQMLELCRLGPNRKTLPWESLYCGETPNNHKRFVDSIRTGIQDQPDFAHGAEIQAILDTCGESARQGKLLNIHK